jgi:hypothetical protein
LFITLLSRNHCLVAEVECREDQVVIHTKDKGLLADLHKIYHRDMSMVEFARANYRLNRWKPYGLRWELVLASEYRRRVS